MPSWLTSQFTNTGNMLTNSYGHSFMVYMQTAVPGTTFAFGANIQQGDGNEQQNDGGEMYSIVLQSDEDYGLGVAASLKGYWRLNEGSGSAADTSTNPLNPLFTNPAGLNFTLQSGSTAIGSGVVQQQQFGALSSYGTGFSPTAVTAADFNGDGNQDLALVNRESPAPSRSS